MTTSPEALARAWRACQAGNLAEAAAMYRQFLRDDAGNADAWCMLGIVCRGLGELDEAAHAYQEALRLRPDFLEVHNNLGNVLQAQGKVDEAIACYRQVLRFRPNSAQTHNNLGAALAGQDKLEEAIACYREAVRCQPDYVEAYLHLGTALGQLGSADEALTVCRHALSLAPHSPAAHNGVGVALARIGKGEEALAHYQHALRLQPNFAEAHINRGNALFEQKKLVEAEASYRQALALKPSSAEAHANLGIVLVEQKRLDEAERCYRKALALKPTYAEAYVKLGVVLGEQGKVDDAVASFRQALRLSPRSLDASNNLAAALVEQGNLDEAVALCRQTLAADPEHVPANNNLGTALTQQGKFAEALAVYRRSVQLEPEDAVGHRNLSMALLLNGDVEEGWREYEWRWRCKDLSPLPDQQPRWDGSALQGQTILLHAEQGLGDTVQFIRYAALVKQRGGQVMAACPRPLLPVLADCRGIDRLVALGEPLPPCDVFAPLLSLPRIFRTMLETIPAEVPYLSADARLLEHWKSERKALPGLAVGIVWQGSPRHKGDRYRSVPLVELAPLAAVEGVRLVSLQVGPGTEQLPQLADRFPVIDWGSRFDPSSLADVAAAIQALDLVVTVDTAVAHLAGALAVPIWVALPAVPDWRWLLEREDSPWYPTMRLFRQAEPGNWQPVFERLAAALCERLQAPDSTRAPASGGESSPRPVSPTQAPVKTSPAAPIRLDPLTEVERRKQVIARKQTDTQRWEDPAQLDPNWNARARIAADLVPAGATVLDLGCGSMALELVLPPNCRYIPCDVAARDGRTLVCDFNAGEFPPRGEATHLAVLGVLEYLYDVPAFLQKLRACERPIILSYNPTDFTAHLDRAALGWVNHLTLAELERALCRAGLCLGTWLRIDANQVLLRLSPDRPVLLPPRTVLVVSALRHGNFGDRLGYHLINEVLPAEATVHHVHMNCEKGGVLENVPEGEFDLLVVGIGNSLFDNILTDDLVNLVNRAPRAVGIFGTQYRQDRDRGRLAAILDRLQTWYARFEEDALFYGRGRRNVVHLGDWLISAFPMTRAQNPEPLFIGQEMWRDLPLDRTIQKIQSYRQVFSSRMHPLLCAFTSAEQVAYCEQRELPRGLVSGKFRSLLLDVFGRHFPEQEFFDVDRAAVAAYKVKVKQRMAELRQALHTALA